MIRFEVKDAGLRRRSAGILAAGLKSKGGLPCVPAGPATIDQRFNVGSVFCHPQVTKGWLSPVFQPSLRDFVPVHDDPNAEALGYCQASIRDDEPRQFSGMGFRSLPPGRLGSAPLRVVKRIAGCGARVNAQAEYLRSVRFVSAALVLFFLCGFALPAQASSTNSIAREWDEQIIAAIRIDAANPPVQVRNLFGLSVCMYDAWAAYTNGPVGYIYRGKATASVVAAARREAISYAAYRILRERYAYSVSASNTLAALDAKMMALGYNTNNSSTNISTPAGVGNSVYAAVSAWFLNDGARQLVAYADYPFGQGGYVLSNAPLATGTNTYPGDVRDVNRWQPLAITNAVDNQGVPLGPVQKFVGAQWLGVRPFALARTNGTLPWIDPGPPPQLGAVGDAAFRTNVVEVIRRSSELTPDDGVMIDISPATFGNNSLGANDGTGRAMNPITGLPYATNLVKRGDFARVLAEFWADGPTSETPPGHWNVIANGIADNTNFIKRFAGTGPVVDNLEWDVKVYFAVNAAVHDAACAAWSLKRFYDGWRPISAIRFMGSLGQSTLTNGPAYDPKGLPLIPGLIELVTDETAAPGGRHEGLPTNAVAIYAWPGQPADKTNQHSGVKWILANIWLPYQRANFVTPAFPGYISGHSTFSRAAAEVLTGITGSPFFPGGLGSYTVTNLSFENGPSQPVTLQWATYFDASDQAGLSRIWGGIHPPVDDFTGRRAGSQCGKAVWALAQKYFDGSVTNVPISLAMRSLGSGQCEVRFNTLRGFYYRLQSAGFGQAFVDDGPGSTRAVEASVARTNAFSGGGKMYRVLGGP